MMDRQIQLYLLGVGNRFRRVRFGWLLAAIWLFLAGGLWAVRESRAESPALVTWTWILGLAVAAMVWFLNRSAFRDWNWLAHRVEETYPDLKQRLLTAIESPSPETVSPALRRQLINDTVRHARTHRWERAVSSLSVLSAWGGQLLCLSVAVGASWISIPGKNSIAGYDSSNPDSSFNGQGLVVEPGDIEIERGTDVVVSARYEGELLDSLLLVATPVEPKVLESGKETESLRTSMRRSLKDPVFGGYLRGVATELRYRVEAGKLTSKEYKVKVFDYPALVRSDAKIVPPVYANQEERIVEDTRRVTVPEGTSLQWTCFVNKTVEEAELVDQSGLAVPLMPSAEDPLKLVATFQIDENRQWTVHLADSENRKAKFEEKLSAKVLRNNAPDIKLAKAQDLQVSPLQEVALQATVSDDFSLKRSGISYTLGEGEPSEIELQPVAAQKGKLQVAHSLDLEASQAKPDQLLSYFFWAEDLDANGNPRRVEGDMFFAEVRPFEEIFREGEAPSQQDQQQQQQQQQQSQAGQQAEKLADLQKKIISGTWNSIRRENATKPSSNFSDDTKVLQESQFQALEKTAELEESIRDAKSGDYLVEVREAMQDAIEKLQEAITLVDPSSLREALKSERKAYEGLLRLRAREHNVVQSQRQQSNSRSQQSGAQQDRQEQLQQLELADQQNQYESQQKAEEESEKGPDRETRQVMNRLDELARRQKDLNEQLKSLENALREAKTPEEKHSVEEQLARLREDQEEMVRDADELLERMNQPENRQSMEQSRQQVEQARQQLQQSSQSLSQGQTSPALSSGTRAERQMEETREQLRQESSNQMEQSMRSMVQQAKEVEKKQKELEQKVAPETLADSTDSSSERESDSSPLRPEGTSEGTGKSPLQEWKEQKERVQQLLQSMQDAVSEAESSEPLLAEQLYETFRESKQSGLEKQLDEIPRLIERGMEEPAKEKAQGASESIEKLREGIEQASEKVLGSERESLRRALRELDRARNELQDEIQANSPSGNSTSNRQAESSAANQPTGESREGTRSEGDRSDGNREESNPQSSDRGNRPDPSNQRPGEQPNGGNNPSAPGENPSATNNPRGDNNPSSDVPPTGNRPNGDREAGNREIRGGNAPREGRSRVGATTEGGGLGNERPIGAAPLTGEEYRAWMDRLRDVEELISDPELKAEVARIREAAREMRVEYKRHSKEPQWPLVRRLLADPLSQLREQVNAELLRQAAEKNAIVPIDRDPVPSNYQRQLDKYYENLGSGKPR